MSNNEVFMHLKEIGNLYIYDVLLSYIYPRVFVCEDEFESKYLFYEVDSTEDKDTWVVAKIRRKDYYELIDRKKPIQHPYSQPNRKFVFAVEKRYGDKDVLSVSLDVSRWIDLLPKEDVYAEKEIISDVAIDTLEAARKSGNATFDIRLFPGSDRHYVPQDIMTELCNSLNSLTSAVFGRRQGNRLSVSTAVGSCVVRFSFDFRTNLLEDESIGEEMHVLNEVLSSDHIEDKLEKVKNKTAFVSSYGRLLKTIKRTNSDVQFITAFPNESSVSRVVDLSSDKVSEKCDSINSIYDEEVYEEEMYGELIAVDLKTRKFKFYCSDKRMIHGDLSRDVMKGGVYEIPASYKAFVEVSRKTDRNNEDNGKKYKLKHLTLTE